MIISSTNGKNKTTITKQAKTEIRRKGFRNGQRSGSSFCEPRFRSKPKAPPTQGTQSRHHGGDDFPMARIGTASVSRFSLINEEDGVDIENGSPLKEPGNRVLVIIIAAICG